jgi:hypothetical protein
MLQSGVSGLCKDNLILSIDSLLSYCHYPSLSETFERVVSTIIDLLAVIELLNVDAIDHKLRQSRCVSEHEPDRRLEYGGIQGDIRHGQHEGRPSDGERVICHVVVSCMSESAQRQLSTADGTSSTLTAHALVSQTHPCPFA